MRMRPLNVFSSSSVKPKLQLVPSLLRRHPFSGLTLLLATSVLLFLAAELALDRLRPPPVFILFGEEELSPPNASSVVGVGGGGQSMATAAYNLEEILALEE